MVTQLGVALARYGSHEESPLRTEIEMEIQGVTPFWSREVA